MFIIKNLNSCKGKWYKDLFFYFYNVMVLGLFGYERIWIFVYCKDEDIV